MDATEAIRTRRSIRQYADEPVSEDLTHQLLEAAMMAPSAGNEQPWHFVVIRDRALLDEIPSFHPYSGMLRQAPLAILICGDETLEKYKGYWVQDCSAATQNLLLEVHARGLGAVWLGVHPIDERVDGMRKLLGMPDHVIPFALISIGWPAEEKGSEDRFDETRVHQDRW